MKVKTLFISALFFLLGTGLVAGGKSEIKTYPNGTTKHELTNLKGQLIKIVSYYPNGEVKEIGHYKNGNRHGAFVCFRENGVKACSAYYYDDKKDGLWNFYNSAGELERQVFFNRNFMVRANPFQVHSESEFR